MFTVSSTTTRAESALPVPLQLFGSAQPNPIRATPCQQHDPDLWFAEQPAQLQAAKDLCRSCPLRQVCLAGALDRAEPWGVWGGELFSGGAVVAMKRGRGRPRKDAAA